MDKVIKDLLYKLDCKDDSWKYDEVNDRILRDFAHRKIGKKRGKLNAKQSNKKSANI